MKKVNADRQNKLLYTSAWKVLVQGNQHTQSYAYTKAQQNTQVDKNETEL